MGKGVSSVGELERVGEMADGSRGRREGDLFGGSGKRQGTWSTMEAQSWGEDVARAPRGCAVRGSKGSGVSGEGCLVVGTEPCGAPGGGPVFARDQETACMFLD